MNNSTRPPLTPCYQGLSVSLLLSALSWLTSRPSQAHDAAARSAIAHHLYLLVRHPASDGTDIEAAFAMVNMAGLDACRLLSRFEGRAIRTH